MLGDNIDTDPIISTEHLTLVPSIPDEYRKLDSLAFCGLPSAAYPIPFIDPNQFQSRYTIIVAGENFGCGSSREHPRRPSVPPASPPSSLSPTPASSSGILSPPTRSTRWNRRGGYARSAALGMLLRLSWRRID
ncbi:hypothetical protein AAC387_Pa06g0106 [Persea americana]